MVANIWIKKPKKPHILTPIKFYINESKVCGKIEERDLWGFPLVSWTVPLPFRVRLGRRNTLSAFGQEPGLLPFSPSPSCLLPGHRGSHHQFFLSYLADLSSLGKSSSHDLGLKFLINLAEPGRRFLCFLFSPGLAWPPFFSRGGGFSAAHEADTKLWGYLGCKFLLLYRNTLNFQASWVPGWWHHWCTCALIEV